MQQFLKYWKIIIDIIIKYSPFSKNILVFVVIPILFLSLEISLWIVIPLFIVIAILLLGNIVNALRSWRL